MPIQRRPKMIALPWQGHPPEVAKSFPIGYNRGQLGGDCDPQRSGSPQHTVRKTALTTSSEEITQLLVEWADGDRVALDKLMPLVYGELRQIAKRYIRRQSPGHTLQTTALIHEAFLKLVNQSEKQWQNRAHFFGVAAQAMRTILVDYARSRQYAKRGGDMPKVALDEAATVSEERAAELVALDDALQLLAQIDQRKSRVVEMRYFGGLSVEETAEVLKVSANTVMRDWRLAKTWLRRELSGGPRGDV
jgi:RNA polymerase sigma factor (TIGR02999 family)